MKFMAARWQPEVFFFLIKLNKFNKAIQIGNLELKYKNCFFLAIIIRDEAFGIGTLKNV